MPHSVARTRFQRVRQTPVSQPRHDEDKAQEAPVEMFRLCVWNRSPGGVHTRKGWCVREARERGDSSRGPAGTLSFFMARIYMYVWSPIAGRPGGSSG